MAELSPQRPSVQGTDLLPPLLSARRDRADHRAGPAARAELPDPEGRDDISRLDQRSSTTWLRRFAGRASSRGRSSSVRSLTNPLGDSPGSFSPFSEAGRRKMATIRNPRIVADVPFRMPRAMPARSRGWTWSPATIRSPARACGCWTSSTSSCGPWPPTRLALARDGLRPGGHDGRNPRPGGGQRERLPPASAC